MSHGFTMRVLLFNLFEVFHMKKKWNECIKWLFCVIFLHDAKIASTDYKGLSNSICKYLRPSVRTVVIVWVCPSKRLSIRAITGGEYVIYGIIYSCSLLDASQIRNIYVKSCVFCSFFYC